MLTLPYRAVVGFLAGIAFTIAIAFAFQAWRADAAPGDTDTTFTPIPPCRLFDYRPAPDTIGTRTTPLHAAETHTQPVTGEHGNCNIPTGIGAVAMNITVLDGTAPSNLAIYPADLTTPPAVSNLNWLPGQAPTPNKVDVKLSPNGAIKLTNAFGDVFVIGDIVGYYTSTSLTELDQDITTLQQQNTTLQAAITALQQADGDLASGDAVIPSGRTVVGSGIWDHSLVTDGEDVQFEVTFPARAPVPLANSTVNFAPGGEAADADAGCTGTFLAPTAPPGRVCIYDFDIDAVGLHAIDREGRGRFDLPDQGFLVNFKGTGMPGDDMFVRYSWAYTAP